MLARVKHLKKGDTVVALSGVSRGKTGKVLEVNQAKGLVKVDGLAVVKRHQKPTQANPKGGIVEKNRWMPASKFMVSSDSGKPKGRVGFEVAKDGTKTRVFRGGTSKKAK
jgi:large subunit ribosomal protein L24